MGWASLLIIALWDTAQECPTVTTRPMVSNRAKMLWNELEAVTVSVPWGHHGKRHRTGGLRSTSGFSCLDPKSEVRACRLLPPAASPWREHAVFSPCPHKNIPLCVRVLISSFKDTGHVASGSTVVASFKVLFKVPNYKHSHVLRCWG